jgi:hypothetical protein
MSGLERTMMAMAVALGALPAATRPARCAPPPPPPATRPTTATAATTTSAPSALISLDLDNAEGAEALAELARAAGVEMAPIHDVVLSSISGRHATLHMTREPYWRVMHELCAQLGIEPLGVRRVPGQKMLGVGLATSGWPLRPYAIGGPFIVMPTTVYRERMLLLGPEPQVTDHCSLSFIAWAEPSTWPLVWESLQIESIEDDAGARIELTGPEFPAAAATGSDTATLQRSIALKLGPKSKAISRIKGVAAMVAQTRSEVLRVERLTTGTSASKTIGSYTIDVRFTLVEDGMNVEVVVGDARREPSSWPARLLYLRGGPAPRLQDAAGQDWYASGPGMAIPHEGPAHTTLHYMRLRRTAGEPATFAWEVPTETIQVRVPFEFRDLPLR